MRTSVLSGFREDLDEQVRAEKQRMTIEGTINKTGLLVVIAFAAAIYPWTLASGGAIAMASNIGYLAAASTLGLALFTMFLSPKSVRFTAPLFSVAYGLMMGGISARYEQFYPGIPMLAVVATFGVLISMLAVYRFGLVKVTSRFKTVVFSLMGTLFFVVLISWVTSLFFGFSIFSMGGPLGLVISGGIVVLMSMYLLVQFDQAKKAAAAGAPKWVEWHCAFGIMVALVWIYMELLKIISIFAGRE